MEDKLRVANRMMNILETNPDLQKEVSKDPVAGMEKIRVQATKAEKEYDREKDKLLYRLALGILGLIALSTAAAAVVFGLQEKTIPEVLVALGSASVGSMVGLFAPSPVSKE